MKVAMNRFRVGGLMLTPVAYVFNVLVAYVFNVLNSYVLEGHV